MHMLEGESGIKLCNKVQDEAPEFRGGGGAKAETECQPEMGVGGRGFDKGGRGSLGRG